MPARLVSYLVATLTAFVLTAAPAFAALADEVSAGAAVAAQLDADKVNCPLTDMQFERLGEYAMDRMVGSRAAHAAMNLRMDQAIGTDNAARMHQLMGRRFAGCGVGDTSSVPFGPGMMGTGHGMMSSSTWSWMRNGDWQRMSSSDWNDLAGTMMGTRYSTDDGWSTFIVVAVAVGTLLLGALLAVLLVMRARRGGSPPTPRAA